MAGALFAIDQDRPSGTSFGSPGVPRRDLWLLRTIRPQIASPVGNNTYLWELLDCPVNSNLRSSPGGPILPITGFDTATPSFDPDKYGPYRLRCTTNGGGPGNVVTLICYARFDVDGVLLRQGRMLPSFGEVASEDDFDGTARGYATQFEERDENTRTRIEALEALIGGAVPPGSENQIAWSNGTTLDFDSRLEFIQNVGHSELHLGVKALLDAHNTSFRIFASNYDDVDDDGVSLELYGGDSVAGLGGDIYMEAGASADIGFKSGSLIFQAGNALNGGEPGDIYLSPGASGVDTGNIVLGTQEVIDFKNMEQGVFIASDVFVAPNEDPADPGLFMWSTTAGSLVTRGSGGLMKLGDRILDTKISAPTLILDADLVTWPAGLLADVRPSPTGFGMRLSVTGSGQFIRLETTQSNASLQVYSDSVQFSTAAGSARALMTPTGLRLGDHTPPTERLEVMGNVAFDLATLSPTIYQKDVTTASATGQVLTIQAQNATGATSVGGELLLKSGTGTSTGGNVRALVPTGSYFRVGAGANNVAWLGSYGPDPTYGLLWLGAGTPSTINYAIAAKMGAVVFINSGPSPIGGVILSADDLGYAQFVPPGSNYGLWFTSSLNDAIIRFVTDGTNGATGKNLTLLAQSVSGTTSTGGNLNLSSGNGTSVRGTVNLQTGGTTRANLTESGFRIADGTAATEMLDVVGRAKVGVGAAKVHLDGYPTTEDVQAAIWLGAAAPTGSNYALVGSASQLILNGPGVVYFAINNDLVGNWVSAGLRVGDLNSPTEKLEVVGNIKIDTTISTPKIFQGDNTTNGATATSLTIQAQNATGTTSTGGTLVLTSGSGTSAAGVVSLQSAGTALLDVKRNALAGDVSIVDGKLRGLLFSNTVAGSFVQFTNNGAGADGMYFDSDLIRFRSGNGGTVRGRWVAAGLRLGDDTAATEILEVAGNIKIGTNSAQKIYQVDVATASATGATLTLQAQNATGTTSTGGALHLTSGTGTTVAGNVNIQAGGVTKISVSPTAVTISSDLSLVGRFTAGFNTAKVILDSFPFSPTTHGSIWLGAITPDNTNEALAGDGTTTTVNGITRVQVAAGSTPHSIFTASGLSIGTTSDPTARLDVVGVVKAGPGSAKVFLGGYPGFENSYGVIWLGNITPDGFNYAFFGDGVANTLFNAPTGTHQSFRFGHSVTGMELVAAGLRIGDGNAATERLEVVGNILFDKDFAAPKLFQGDITTASATGQALTIQAQNATGATSVGGNLVLKSGTGTTNGGRVFLSPAGTNIVSVQAHSVNTATGAVNIVENGTAGFNSVLTVHAANGNPYLVRLYNDTFNTTLPVFSYYADNSGNFVMTTESATPMIFSTNGYASERLRITDTLLQFSVATVQFATAVSSPKLSQADNTTNSATGQALTIQAQNATGTTSTGGMLDLRSGTGTSAPGVVTLRVGTTQVFIADGGGVSQYSQLIGGTSGGIYLDADIIRFRSSGGTEKGRWVAAGLRIGDGATAAESLDVLGNAKVSALVIANAAGTLPITLRAWTSISTYSALYCVVTPGTNNFSLLSDGSSQWLNAPSGSGQIYFTIGNTNQGVFTTTGLRVGDSTLPGERLEVVGNIKIATATAQKIFQQDFATADSTAPTLTVQASNATGSNGNGGKLFLTSGTAGSGGSVGNVEIQTAGTMRIRVREDGIFFGTSAQLHSMVGGFNYTTRTVSSSIAIDTTTTDYILLVNTSAARTITLPTPTQGRKFLLFDIIGSASTNNITLARSGSEKIAGTAANKVFSTDWGAWIIVSDGTDWFIL